MHYRMYQIDWKKQISLMEICRQRTDANTDRHRYVLAYLGYTGRLK